MKSCFRGIRLLAVVIIMTSLTVKGMLPPPPPGAIAGKPGMPPPPPPPPPAGFKPAKKVVTTPAEPAGAPIAPAAPRTATAMGGKSLGGGSEMAAKLAARRAAAEAHETSVTAVAAPKPAPQPFIAPKPAPIITQQRPATAAAPVAGPSKSTDVMAEMRAKQAALAKRREEGGAVMPVSPSQRPQQPGIVIPALRPAQQPQQQQRPAAQGSSGVSEELKLKLARQKAKFESSN